MEHGIRIADCGDSAVLVRAAGSGDDAWPVVHALADAVEAAGLNGVHGIVPAYDSLLVEFDCAVTDHAAVRRAVAVAARGLGGKPVPPTRRFTVPVVYGGEYGPDLPLVADQLGLTEEEVIRRHTARHLTVRCLGAPAGGPLRGGPPFGQPVARLASPRTSVPPGSVAVAGRQAVICPVRSPGGWPLVGRTPLRVLDLDREPHTPYRPGDTFRFVPITPADWHDYEGALRPDQAAGRG
jgi:inhibitor of KinA